MMLGRILGKFILALVLLGVGTYFLIGSDTATNAQAATAPDYKVEWTATRLIVLDFDKLFYPIGQDGHSGVDPDPVNFGAKTLLAIGPAEWQVKFNKKEDGCDDNIPRCYDDGLIYEETWNTGPIGTDNCYKVPANCDNSNPSAKYVGQWNWSLGGEYLQQGFWAWGGKSLRSAIEITTTEVSYPKLYKNNSDVFIALGWGWGGGAYPTGKGPGFLEYFGCNKNVQVGRQCGQGFIAGMNGIGPNFPQSFYTSGAYAWQMGGAAGGEDLTDANGARSVGLYMPTKWFVEGTIYE